jgi:hypothetical protein
MLQVEANRSTETRYKHLEQAHITKKRALEKIGLTKMTLQQTTSKAEIKRLLHNINLLTEIIVKCESVEITQGREAPITTMAEMEKYLKGKHS